MSLPPLAYKVLTAPQMAQFIADGVSQKIIH